MSQVNHVIPVEPKFQNLSATPSTDLFKTCEDELSKDDDPHKEPATSKWVASQDNVAAPEKKSKVFDANSDPVPINPIVEKYQNTSDPEETKTDLTSATPSDERPYDAEIKANPLNDESLLETVVASPKSHEAPSQSDSNLNDTQFVDLMKESQFPLASGTRAFITRNLKTKNEPVNLRALKSLNKAYF